eukprot:366086-Chlamydomonas_euryale.AAC.1
MAHLVPQGGEPAGDDPTAVEVILKALNDRNGNIRHAMPGVRGDVAFVRLVRATTQVRHVWEGQERAGSDTGARS